jgi:hypothetical protein
MAVTVNARLQNAAFYDVRRFDLVKGQKAALEVLGYDGVIDWASTGDSVLDIVAPENVENAFGYIAEITAKEKGESRVFVIEKTDEGFPILKELKIRVLDEIKDPAVNLGVEITPIDKQ